MYGSGAGVERLATESTTLSAAADLRVLCGPRFDTFTARTDDGEAADRFVRAEGHDLRHDDGDRWDGLG